MDRTHLNNPHVCDGGYFRVVQGARSDVWLFQTSDEQHRNARKEPRPAGLRPKSASAALLGLPISTYGLRLAPCIRIFLASNASREDY